MQSPILFFKRILHLPIRHSQHFCILKIECQAVEFFQSLTFARLWVSFPQVSNMSSRMQVWGSWRRRRGLCQKADFCILLRLSKELGINSAQWWWHCQLKTPSGHCWGRFWFWFLLKKEERNYPENLGKTSSPNGWLGTGTGLPGQKASWSSRRIWPTLSDRRLDFLVVLWGLGLNDPWVPLAIQSILWFRDFSKTSLDFSFLKEGVKDKKI